MGERERKEDTEERERDLGYNYDDSLVRKIWSLIQFNPTSIEKYKKSIKIRVSASERCPAFNDRKDPRTRECLKELKIASSFSRYPPLSYCVLS